MYIHGSVLRQGRPWADRWGLRGLGPAVVRLPTQPDRRLKGDVADAIHPWHVQGSVSSIFLGCSASDQSTRYISRAIIPSQAVDRSLVKALMYIAGCRVTIPPEMSEEWPQATISISSIRTRSMLMTTLEICYD